MVTSGFFNSVNGDRKYSAEQMSAIFNGIINDGVFVNVGTAFAITADVGNKVLVGVGRAWIDSTWIYNDTPLEVELEDSDILTDRIDAVVLESDHSAPVRIGSIKVVKGVAQTNPVRPTMEHSFYVNQYPIAYILRPKNSTAITQANITYMVGTSELPFVTGILETLDIDALVAQWGAEWREWFDAIKDEFGDDVAGNLQLQINDLKERFGVRGNELYAGNIDVDLKPDSMFGDANICGGYLCSKFYTKGTLPEFKIEDTSDTVVFYVVSDPSTNGYFQYAIPLLGTKEVSGIVAIRCYMNNEKWSIWSYMRYTDDNELTNLKEKVTQQQIKIQDLEQKLNEKQNTITGAASTITDHNLSANTVMISNENGKASASDVSYTELAYLKGVTGNIQSQINTFIKIASVYTSYKVTDANSFVTASLSNIPGIQQYLIDGVVAVIPMMVNTSNGIDGGYCLANPDSAQRINFRVTKANTTIFFRLFIFYK